MISDGHTRDGVIRALVALVAERGMDAVSVRQVADAAGVSAGFVQHHFRTKQAMLAAAMDAVTGQVESRVRAVADQEPADALREIARQLVPLDDERAVEGRISLAFVAHAITDPELSANYQRTWRRLEELLTGLIAAVRGRARGSADDRAAAALLLATIDGLAIGGVAEPGRLDRRRIAALLARQLDAVTRDGRPGGSAAR
ncbi:MAG TPA: TetR/AcrR family transcriptional regulator [Actinokineospora sp.]|nr:TetR/AcrR family transcriptional regulator [Actinokineospora sp.]